MRHGPCGHGAPRAPAYQRFGGALLERSHATSLEAGAAASLAVRAFALLAVAAVLLSGCSGSPDGEAAAEPEPIVITRPDDFTNATAPGSHIHDYWGGQGRITVVDATHPGGDAPGTGPGFASGPDVKVRSFQPDSGHVVPQGTAAVDITFTWTDAELDAYADPVLWLKTAGQNATEEVAPVTNGEPVTIETGLADADLPHQLLSAWLFELRMSSPDPMPLRFKGAVSLKVEAIRGLPLPVFPPHPDRWLGAQELPLVESTGQLSYLEDLGDGGCNGMSCPQVFRPGSGRVVPSDAYLVHVTLTYGGARDLDLHYHTGLEREFLLAEPISRMGGVATYEILVGDGGDGPYATQSQWEFTVLPPAAGPVRTTWASDYEVTAVAAR